MDLNGRGGAGTLHQMAPPATVVFSFKEGMPIDISATYEEQSGSLTAVAISWSHEPRYACLGGIDSFGRASGDQLTLAGQAFPQCGSTTNVPR
jgi:hypothetical protein